MGERVKDSISLLFRIIRFKRKILLFDSRTYSILEITSLIEEILKTYPHKPTGFISRDKYSAEQVKKGLLEIEQLIENGVISTRDDPYMETQSLNKIILLLAEDCNLACKYCFEKGKIQKSNASRMNISTADKSLEFLFNNSRYKNLAIQFYGGEPLLNKPVLKHVVTKAIELSKSKNKNVNFILITNGTLIEENIRKFICENKIHIQVSIDGYEKGHDANRVFPNGRGSYNIALNGLKKLTSEGATCNIMVVLSKAVLADSHWVNRLSDEVGRPVAFCSCSANEKNMWPGKGEWLNFLTEYRKFIESKTEQYTVKNDEVLLVSRMYDQIKSGNRLYLGCGAGTSELTINFDGEIYLCERMDAKTGANVHDFPNPLDLWQPYVNNILNKKCRRCWAKYLCGGGCAQTARTINKNTSPYHWDCEIKKLGAESAIKFLYNENLKNIKVASVA